MASLLFAARFVHFAAAMALFGAPLFLLCAPAAGASEDRRAAEQVVARLVRVAVPLALASALAWAGASLVAITDDGWSLLDPSALSGFFLETGFGAVWLVRLALLALLALVVSAGGAGRRSAPVVAVAAGFLLVSLGPLGHAGAGHGVRKVVLLTAHALHVLGAAAWIGGLLPLIALLNAWRAAEPDAGARRAGPILRRFSLVGMIAVALVAAGGIASAALHLEGFGALATTAYGRMVLGKIVLFAALLALAARNRHLSGRLRQGGDVRGDLSRVGRNSKAEIALAGLVLLAAAALGMSDPGA